VTFVTAKRFHHARARNPLQRDVRVGTRTVSEQVRRRNYPAPVNQPLSIIQETTMKTTNPSARLRGFIATAILSALASSFAAVCTGADSSDTRSETVKFGDLNVSNPEGAAALYRRIAAAANKVCSSFENDSRYIGSQASLNACVHKAIADAVTKVGRPELITVYNSKNRQPLPVTVAFAKTR
jgi:UrcA family protein